MSDRFSIIKRCCSWLEKVVFDRVWNEPYAEFRTNTRPRILNGMTEVSVGFSSDNVEQTKKIYTPIAGVLTGNFEQIELPHTGTSFYVYAVDTGLFDTIKLRSDAWTSLANYSDKHLLELQVYSDSGKMLYRGGSFIRQSEHADMVLLAVDAAALHTSCDFYVDDGAGNPVKERYDPSAIYLTKYFESDFEADNTVVSRQLTAIDVNKIRVHRTDPIPDNTTLALYNGQLVSGSYINDFKIGDYIEYTIDRDVVSTITLDRSLDTCPIYENNQGKKRLLIHVPLADNLQKYLITYNTCDVYLIPQRMNRLYTLANKPKEISGVFVHQCERGENFHQLTFNDFSIDLDLLDQIAEENGFAEGAYFVKVIVRTHKKKLGLIRDANYADILYTYKHKDEDIVAFLTGKSQYIEEFELGFWTAANLEENSAYATELISRLGHTIPAQIRGGRYRHVTEKKYIEGKQYYSMDVEGEYKEVEVEPGSPVDEGMYSYTSATEYPEKETVAGAARVDGSMEFRNYDGTKIDIKDQCLCCGAYSECTKHRTGEFIRDKGCPDFTVRTLRDYVKIFGFFQTLSLICWRVSQFKVIKDFRTRISGFQPKYVLKEVKKETVVKEGQRVFCMRYSNTRAVPYRSSVVPKDTMLLEPKGVPSYRQVKGSEVDLSNTVYLYCQMTGSIRYLKDTTETIDPNGTYYIVSYSEFREVFVPAGMSIAPDIIYFTTVKTAKSELEKYDIGAEVGDIVYKDHLDRLDVTMFAADQLYIGDPTEDGDPIYKSENNIIHVRVPLVLADRPSNEFDVLVYVNGYKVASRVLGDCYMPIDGLLEIYHSYVPRMADERFSAEQQRRLCVEISGDVQLKKGDFITAEVVYNTEDNLAKFIQKFDITEKEDSDTLGHKYAHDVPCSRENIRQFDNNSEVVEAEGVASEYIFLNGRLLTPTIDYVPYTFTKSADGVSPTIAQNISYITEETDNQLEVLSTSDQRIGMEVGFTRGNWLEWDGISPFWFDNLSVLSIDGVVITDFENKYSGIEIKDVNVENGRPFYVRTSAPIAAIRAMEAKDLMDADTLRMRHIADYFNRFRAEEKFRMCIPYEHKVFSIYLHAIISSMITEKKTRALAKAPKLTRAPVQSLRTDGKVFPSSSGRVWLKYIGSTRSVSAAEGNVFLYHEGQVRNDDGTVTWKHRKLSELTYARLQIDFMTWKGDSTPVTPNIIVKSITGYKNGGEKICDIHIDTGAKRTSKLFDKVHNHRTIITHSAKLGECDYIILHYVNKTGTSVSIQMACEQPANVMPEEEIYCVPSYINDDEAARGWASFLTWNDMPPYLRRLKLGIRNDWSFRKVVLCTSMDYNEVRKAFDLAPAYPSVGTILDDVGGRAYYDSGWLPANTYTYNHQDIIRDLGEDKSNPRLMIKRWLFPAVVSCNERDDHDEEWSDRDVPDSLDIPSAGDDPDQIVPGTDDYPDPGTDDPYIPGRDPYDPPPPPGGGGDDDPDTPGGDDPDTPGGDDPVVPPGPGPDDPGTDDPDDPGGGGDDPGTGGDDPDDPGDDPDTPGGGDDPVIPPGPGPDDPGGDDPDDPDHPGGGDDPDDPFDPHGGSDPGLVVDPTIEDEDEFLAQFKDFEWLKQYDVVYHECSNIDLDYVDIYPTFHNLDIVSRELRRTIAYVLSRLMPTDTMRHREHIDG